MSDWYILNEDKTTSLVVTEEDKLRAYAALSSLSKIVAQEEIGNARVSTIFLGLDHAWGVGESPLLFETMVFPSEDMWRYHTYQEALEGHRKACAELTSGLSREELEASKVIIESLLSSSDKC
jgi:hypothetical protein